MITQRIRPRVNIDRRRKELELAGVRHYDDSLFGELLRKGYDDDFEPSEMCQPSICRPGSIEKIEVLSLRLVAGETLHHELDQKLAATIEEQSAMMKFISCRR